MYSALPHRVSNAVIGTIIVGLVFVGSVSAYTYSAWTTMTGAKTFAINPFFYGAFSDMPGTGTDLVAGYGFTDKFDLFINLSTLSPVKDFSYGGSYIMPRYDFGNNNIIALQMGYDGNEFAGGPQYHFVWDKEKFTLEANAAVTLYSSDMAAPYIFGTLGWVWKAVKDVLYPFVELNPSYQVGPDGGFDFVPAPGVWIGIPNTTHQFALSIRLNGVSSGSIDPGFGMWYWFSIGGNE